MATHNKMLIPCLRCLFDEFDLIAPSRDHASDGDIGNTAHQAEVSDHNDDEVGKVPIHDADHIHEIHAIDVDNNLNESDLTMEKCVQFLLGRCRSGAEKRLRYIIYNRRIWSASSGWVQKTYTGASPHTEHAHFSASYETKLEASTASWHLEDIPVSLTAADKAWMTATIKAQAIAAVQDQLDEIANKVLTGTKIAGTTTPGNGDFTRNLAQVVSDPWAMVMKGTTWGGGDLPDEGAYGEILADLGVIKAKLASLTK
jgi:hypothetical protein